MIWKMISFQDQFFEFWSSIALMNPTRKAYTYYPLLNL